MTANPTYRPMPGQPDHSLLATFEAIKAYAFKYHVPMLFTDGSKYWCLGEKLAYKACLIAQETMIDRDHVAVTASYLLHDGYNIIHRHGRAEINEMAFHSANRLFNAPQAEKPDHYPLLTYGEMRKDPRCASLLEPFFQVTRPQSAQASLLESFVNSAILPAIRTARQQATRQFKALAKPAGQAALQTAVLQATHVQAAQRQPMLEAETAPQSSLSATLAAAV